MTNISQIICDHRGVHEISNSTLRNPDPWLIEAFGGSQESESGVRVTPRAIMSHVPILQGLTIIAGDCAMLPLILKRTNGEATQEDRTHTAWRLSAQQANPLMWSIAFWELMLTRAILNGNGISEVSRDSMGRALPASQGGMTPLMPDKTQPEYDDKGNLWIVTRVQINGREERRAINPVDTVHIKGLSADGFWGLSLREVAQDTIGYGIGLRKFGNYTFRNRARPDFVFRHPGVMDDEAYARFKTSWNATHQGLDNVARYAILEEDMGIQQLSQTNEQAQMVELLRMSVEDSSRILNIPPHMLNMMERATFNNIEEQGLSYINRTLGRWLRKITQELHAKLLLERERDVYFFEFNVDQLIQGKLRERAEAYSKLIASEVLNKNEARAELGWDPYDGGDEFGNPNTTSNRQPAETSDTEDRIRRLEEQNTKLLAHELQSMMRHEDEKIHAAAGRESDFPGWLDRFYESAMRRRLEDLVGDAVALEYCAERHDFWINTSDKTDTADAFTGVINAEREQSRERGRKLLNKELNPCERNGFKTSKVP